MQKKIEIDKVFFERLNLRHAEIKAERDRLQQELQTLKAGTPGLWSRATVATVGIMAVTSLLYTGDIHDAQSNIKEHDLTEMSAISALETGRIMRGNHQATSDKKPSRSDKNKTRFTRAKAASQRQWGPLLVIPAAEASKSHSVFDPLLKEQQANLLTLGFDLGKADGIMGTRTRQAIAEFRALYLPDTARELKDANLAVIMESYADLARRDAARYGIDHGIVAAIRLSSVRTGVDFSYLMKLAATESNFEPAIEAETSSATGLYQFTHDTWLKTLKMHGEKYGFVADYAAKIEYYETRSGYQRPIVRDQSLYQHLLELRKNPRLSSMMAAETVRDNQQKLLHSLDHEPTETDLYLAHFLGIDKAITFVRSLKQSPGTHAVELFPMAASSNHDIFHPRSCEPRTVDEVYALFDEKFSSRRYDDFAAN